MLTSTSLLEMANSSSISEFLLLALADTRQLQLLHFWLLLGIYLAALLGNGLISTAVACDHRLHTPMYFFLLNLALLDLGCISTTLPKAWPMPSGTPGPSPTQDVLHRSFCLPFCYPQNIPFSPSCPMTATLPSASPCTTGPCWAAELVPPWQRLPGALGSLIPCCTLPIHFHCLCAKAMLWISSSVKSPTSSSSPAQNPMSWKLGLF
uniref:G-protein coupled receptors family 1 profile domain-containing protein n=1 Tax=Gallus gallus TaxID=9031 RepID=A0A8V0XB02_CHICK